MVTLSAYGLSVNATAGWDGSIYKRRDEGFSNQLGAREQRDLHAAEYQPIVHLSTLALPVVRGDMGGSVVSELGLEDVYNHSPGGRAPRPPPTTSPHCPHRR